MRKTSGPSHEPYGIPPSSVAQPYRMSPILTLLAFLEKGNKPVYNESWDPVVIQLL